MFYCPHTIESFLAPRETAAVALRLADPLDVSSRVKPLSPRLQRATPVVLCALPGLIVRRPIATIDPHGRVIALSTSITIEFLSAINCPRKLLYGTHLSARLTLPGWRISDSTSSGDTFCYPRRSGRRYHRVDTHFAISVVHPRAIHPWSSLRVICIKRLLNTTRPASLHRDIILSNGWTNLRHSFRHSQAHNTRYQRALSQILYTLIREETSNQMQANGTPNFHFIFFGLASNNIARGC